MFNRHRHLSTAVRISVIILIIVAAITMQRSGILDTEKLLAAARGYTDYWWIIPVLILIQIFLYSFALAGSYALWVVAPIYSPVTSTLILVAGGTLGAMGAYFVSRSLTEKWIQRVEKSRAYRLLSIHNTFFASFAMRLFPGFPHSLISYSSGILKTRMKHFVPAAVCGLAIKFYIYSSAVHTAATAVVQDDSLLFDTVWPLVVLSLLLLAGVFVNARLYRRNVSAD